MEGIIGDLEGRVYNFANDNGLKGLDLFVLEGLVEPRHSSIPCPCRF